MNRRLAPGLLQRIAPPVLMNRRRVCSRSGLFLVVRSWSVPGLFLVCSGGCSRRVCSVPGLFLVVHFWSFVPGLVCSWSFRVCFLLHEPERRRGGTMNDARAASRSIESPAVVRQSESAPAELMKGENRRLSALIPDNVLLFVLTDKNKMDYRLSISGTGARLSSSLRIPKEKPQPLHVGGGLLTGDKSDGSNQTRPRIAPGESWRISRNRRRLTDYRNRRPPAGSVPGLFRRLALVLMNDAGGASRSWSFLVYSISAGGTSSHRRREVRKEKSRLCSAGGSRSMN